MSQPDFSSDFSEAQATQSLNAETNAQTKAQTNSPWFEYPIRVQPHHTDYGGVVWHGTYVAWLEEARVEALRSVGINYADWVAMGCELPVVELSIRYHRSLRLGMQGIVKVRMVKTQGVRIPWDYRIESPDAQELYLVAQVTLVAIDLEKRKIMRRLPAAVEAALQQIGRSSLG